MTEPIETSLSARLDALRPSNEPAAPKLWRVTRHHRHRLRHPLKRLLLSAFAAVLVLGLAAFAQRVFAFDPASGIDFLLGKFPWLGFVLESADPGKRLLQPHLYGAVFFVAFASVWTLFGSQPGRAAMNRIWPEPPPFLNWPIEPRNRLDPFSRATPFVGRDSEMRQLRRFAAAPGALLWYGVCGRCGVGKTRLAVEWLCVLEASARRWDVGVLSRPFELRELEDWRPRRPTAILVDEAAAERDLWQLLAGLAAKSASYRHPVRLLLVDSGPLRPQGASDEVSANLAHRLRDLNREPSTTPADTTSRLSSYEPFLALGPLTTAEHIAAAARQASARPMTDREARDLHKRSEGSPFLAILLASPGDDGAQTARDRLALKAEQLVDQADRALHGRAAALKLCSLAALAGPIPGEYVRKLIPAAGDIETLAALFPDTAATTLRHEVPALRPELVAREVLVLSLSELQDVQVREVIDTGFAVNAAAACRFIAGLWRDRPERALAYALKNGTADGSAMTLMVEDESAARMLKMLAEQVEVHLGAEARQQAQEQAQTLVDDTSKDFSGSELLALDETVAVLEEIASVWPFAVEIQIQRAMGTVNAIYRYGEHARWYEMAAAIGRLEETAGAWPKVEKIQFYRAAGALNAIGHYGKHAQWDEMAAAIGSVEETASAWPEVEQIQLCRAKGAVNAINRYGEHARWDETVAATGRLEETANAWPEVEEIQLERAKGAVNAISHYGEHARWDEMAAAIGRLEETANAWPEVEQIQLCRAIGALNAISRYGEHARWDEMAAAIGRLEETAGAWPKVEQIQLRRARGALNASSDYGEHARWDEMAAAIGRLEETASAWPKVEQIQRCRAMGAHNVMVLCPIKHLRAVARQYLIEVARAFPADAEIQNIAAEHGLNFAALESRGEICVPTAAGASAAKQ